MHKPFILYCEAKLPIFKSIYILLTIYTVFLNIRTRICNPELCSRFQAINTLNIKRGRCCSDHCVTDSLAASFLAIIEVCIISFLLLISKLLLYYVKMGIYKNLLEPKYAVYPQLIGAQFCPGTVNKIHSSFYTSVEPFYAYIKPHSPFIK